MVSTYLASTELDPDAVIQAWQTHLWDSGPEMDTVYIPGTPGAAWTMEEVESTRLKTFQLLIPLEYLHHF